MELSDQHLEHDIRPKPERERASSAEMRFAGHYLNLAGVLLLLTGLVSYLKSAAPSGGSALATGVWESLIGASLGVVLLVAGEYLFRKGFEQFAPPVLTAGYCLLFFVACSAHFRHQLLDESTLFMLLLGLVTISNASVLRYDSKLIGNVMSVVYFSAPLVLAFEFDQFAALFLYLFAINLGTAVVALRKKWDFQLVVAALGSYTLYFLHFRGESGDQALALLLLIYALSFVANNVIFFTRPQSSNFNLLVSFVNPSAFAAFSSMVLLEFSNWVPVSVYLLLALGHAWVAKIADARRAENRNFEELATNNLLLSLLFLSAGISFVTYFSSETRFFGLVTLLWFGLALILLLCGFSVTRHRVLLSRFSLFALALVTFQVTYVLPSMGDADALLGLSFSLYVGYYALLALYREKLTSDQVLFVQGSVLLGVGVAAKVAVAVVAGEFLPFVLLTSGAACAFLSVERRNLSFLRWSGHFLLGLGVWKAFRVWDLADGAWLTLPLATLFVGLSAQRALKRGFGLSGFWDWTGVLLIGMALLPAFSSIPATLVALSLAHFTLTWIGQFSDKEKMFNGLAKLCGFGLIASLLLGARLPLGVVFAVWGFTSLSVWMARKLGHQTTLVASAPAVIFFADLALQVYRPYPMLSLCSAALFGALLMRASRPRAALRLQFLVACGVLLWPRVEGLEGWLGLAGISLSFALTYRWSRSQARAAYAPEDLECMAAVVLARLSLFLDSGPIATLCWALLACFLLRHSSGARDWNLLGQGAFDFSRLLLFAAFIKSIVYDANFLTSVGPLHFACSILLAGLFLCIAHGLVMEREARNALAVSGLLILCFQVTFLLHRSWGDLVLFQPLLSGFWSIIAFLIVAVGIALQVNAYRFFGLTTLVASVLKILLVDIHVLDSYSQTNTYLILGSLLVTTSLLYQKQRERLCGEARPLGDRVLGESLLRLG